MRTPCTFFFKNEFDKKKSSSTLYLRDYTATKFLEVASNELQEILKLLDFVVEMYKLLVRL